MNPYERLGVRRVVNCMGARTDLGGLPLSEGVIEATRAAARVKVDLTELVGAVGARIAELTGTEAAFITSGAAAAFELGAVACVTGCDPVRVAKVPALDSGRTEIAIHRKHRCNFDHALRNSGATLVEFGYGRDVTWPWEMEEAIGERTAAVAYIANFGVDGVMTLEDVVRTAHEHAVPVVVDCAVSLPPASNLRAIPATGADLCCFSGGKDIGGPQNTGFLAGSVELIEACVLNANPNPNTIGRPLKVNAEAVVGLLVALEEYVSADHDARTAQQLATLEHLHAVFGGDERCAIVPISNGAMPVPTLHVRVDGGPGRAVGIIDALRAGDPSIRVGIDDDRLVINPHALRPDDVELVAERLGALLGVIVEDVHARR